MLFTGWEIRIEKYFVSVPKTSLGRPRAVFETSMVTVNVLLQVTFMQQ